MFNLQGSEIIFILLIALVVLGPEKLPGAIRRVVSLYNELRKLSSGFQDEFKSVLDEPLRELKDTANLMKGAADPKRIAEEAEREVEMKAAADKKQRQAREASEAMETAGAEHLAGGAIEPEPETAPVADAFADPVDDEQDGFDDATDEADLAESDDETEPVPRLSSVDLDVGLDGEAEEKSA